MFDKIIQGFALYDIFKRLSNGFKDILPGSRVGDEFDMPVPPEYADNNALLLKGPSASRWRVLSIKVARER